MPESEDTRPTLYFSHAFTNADPEYRETMKQVTDWMKKPERPFRLLPHFSEGRRYEPLTHGKEIWEIDIDNGSRVADYFVGEISLPATGVGIEIGTAVDTCEAMLLLFTKHGPQLGSSALAYAVQFRYTNKVNIVTHNSGGNSIINAIEQWFTAKMKCLAHC
jgi:hypothetical protein